MKRSSDRDAARGKPSLSEQKAKRRFEALQQAYPLKVRGLLLMHARLAEASRSPLSTIAPWTEPTTYEDLLAILLRCMSLNDMQETPDTPR